MVAETVNAENVSCSMNLPPVENGEYEVSSKYDDNVSVGTIIHVICKMGYSLKDTRVNCSGNGTWFPDRIYCRAVDNEISYVAIIFVCIASGVIVVIILMITVIILHRKRRSKCKERIPRWTRNQQERRQKSSSELVERIYKELVESRRGLQSFHQFSAAQAWTRKKMRASKKSRKNSDQENSDKERSNTTVNNITGDNCENMTNKYCIKQHIYYNFKENFSNSNEGCTSNNLSHNVINIKKLPHTYVNV
ncbi:uncharacterized protein LOC111642664 isoform X2 [Centruroides sculpturatus]|uniref:uncharacterized protein LOC111642664 isoform X2 n=1 Tax=Centruroides sculpturatus TaxID=218467 RepID=UPI000C6D2EC6|nr:uncharacterized protein LOC111642664 isoform X2 [Centruroides sculpturatus]